MRKSKLKPMIENPTVPNKYNLTVQGIRRLSVDRSKITEKPFWRNDVIKAWCLSGTTAKTWDDDMWADEYWLGVYDDDAPSYAGQVRVSFTAYSGMASYIFNEFYSSRDIKNEEDFRIQELFWTE